MYSCGKGNFGRLGHGIEENFERMTELRYFRNKEIRVDDIATGGRHCLAISDQAKRSVYVWGFNFYHQLGLGYGQSDDVLQPLRVNLRQEVVGVQCGHLMSAILVNKK